MTTPSDPTTSSTSLRALEIAHVLFMDIVAYSQLPVDEQIRLIELLQQIVRNTAEFTQARKRRQLLRLPTGDGMALVFFGDAEAPARCAIEIGKALRGQPGLKLRMGIHTGPVQRVEDINASRNVAGGGINLAQRVMDCGDAGHILVSMSVADVLSNMSNWKTMLHDLGEVVVKHGVTVSIYNLYSDEAGNRELPHKLLASRRTASGRKRKRIVLELTVAGALVALAVGTFVYYRQRPKLTDRDTVMLADFANKTGDEIFDDTLKTALSVALNQSPFLNVLSESKVRKTLKLMTRPADTKLTPDVAREVCQRVGSKAYIVGSIANLGSQYVLELKAVNCQSDDLLAQEQVTASAKEKVLDTLGEAASSLRGELGESLATVQRLDVPLSEATTSSLEALQAYSLGNKAFRQKGDTAALPYHQRAIQLDPNFAIAYSAIGSDYTSIGELDRASEYYTKAFEFRGHASEQEKLFINAHYYGDVTGELDKAAQAYQDEIESYPRNYVAHVLLCNVYHGQGQYEKSADACRQSLLLAPDNVAPYDDLANTLLALQQFGEARQLIQQAQTQKLTDFILHNDLYALDFLAGDSPAMVEQQQWFAEHSDVESFGLSLASDAAAYAGHLKNAEELTKRSVDSAIHAESKENGAIWQENAALREAAFGNIGEAKRQAAQALNLAPNSQGVEDEAALAFAMAGDVARAESLAQDLSKRFPLDTQMQSLWMPAIHGQLALNLKNPSAAIGALQPATGPIELGQIAFVANLSCLYPTYIRGESYLAAEQGKEAAIEFQKILDHTGIVWGCWTGALAHLGLARANALQARTARAQDADAARVRAIEAYKDFLTLWRDADPDIPMLKQAKAEYAKLQ